MNRRSIAAALTTALLFSGCQGRQGSLKWVEDVRLPDGRIVTLTRYQEFKGPHELGETPSASDYWFEFTHPDTGETVRWQSDRDLATIALMMDAQAPVLLVQPNFGGIYRRGCPNPPYLLYRYAGHQWAQIPLSKIPVTRLRANMTFSADDQRNNIEASGYRLTVDRTSASERNHKPYVINFSLMKVQTFSLENCGRNFDLLIEN